MRTPWGTADYITDIGQGVLSVGTPSHGGFHVPKALLHRIPAEGQEYAERWSGSAQWYEEDCAWAYVALALPEFFSDEDREHAKSTLGWLEGLH